MSRSAGSALQAIYLLYSSVDLPAYFSCFAHLCHGIDFLKTYFNAYISACISKHVDCVEI